MKRKKRRNGITRRWTVVSLVTTILILTVASVAIILLTRRSYYENAQQVLEYRLEYTLLSIPSSGTSEGRGFALRDMVENFGDTEKSKFEFMLVRADGRVLATSSGFAYGLDEPMEDFYGAAVSEDGIGVTIDYSAAGEHIIAVTQMLTHPAGEVSAIRYVSSLKNIDAQMRRVIQIDIAVCGAMILFTLLSGIYFVRSIVVPLSEVGRTASRIADGDLDVRVDNVYNDEIGELGDIINDMAAGLSMTDRMKNEFISSVSHELRTPLTSIRGWGETLRQVGGNDTKLMKKGLDIIIGETERLSVLVEDLLDFSRLQSGGQMRTEWKKLDILPEILHTIGIFEQKAKSTEVTFKTDFREREIVVNADKNRLRQVLSNIFDNAIKYSKEGTVIRVQASIQDQFAQIVIKDDGVGIPPDDLPKITEKFFKASNAVTGSGIGLAVVKEIIALHGGSIRFDSELEKGTQVTVALPLA